MFLGSYLGITGRNHPTGVGGVVWIIAVLLLLLAAWYDVNNHTFANPIYELYKIPYFLPFGLFIYLGVFIHKLERSARTKPTDL